MLHARQKWHKTTEDLKEGELVLIVDPSLSRGQWRLARVVQPIVTGSHVRKARVRTADSKLWLRDRSNLVRLEIDNYGDGNNDIQLQDD